MISTPQGKGPTGLELPSEARKKEKNYCENTKKPATLDSSFDPVLLMSSSEQHYMGDLGNQKSCFMFSCQISSFDKLCIIMICLGINYNAILIMTLIKPY